MNTLQHICKGRHLVHHSSLHHIPNGRAAVHPVMARVRAIPRCTGLRWTSWPKRTASASRKKGPNQPPIGNSS